VRLSLCRVVCVREWCVCGYTCICIHVHRQAAESQTNREADRQIDRQIHRQTDRKKDRQTDRQTDTHTQTRIHRHRHTRICTHTHTHMYIYTHICIIYTNKHTLMGLMNCLFTTSAASYTHTHTCFYIQE